MSIKTDNSQTLVNAIAEIERLRGRVSELEVWRSETGDSLDFQVLLAELHKEIWEAAESGEVCYDDAGKDTAKRVIASHESQRARGAWLQTLVDTFGNARTTASLGTEAWLLRKQAEAVEAARDEICEFRGELWNAAQPDELTAYAQRLRQQADELESNNEQNN